MYDSIWYTNLPKSFLMPPNWLFAPVWFVLYLMIFLSLVIYTTTKTRHNKIVGYIYFIVQMLLNIIWSPIFFLMKNVGLALLVLVFLDIFVYLTIKKFYEVSKISAQILYPYFLWILFATYLNMAIFFNISS